MALHMKQITLKGVFRIIAKVALAMMVILLVSAILLWFFLPLEQISSLITKGLSKRLNQDITMGEFSVEFYPGVSFVGRNMRMVDPPTSQEILSTPKASFKLAVKDLIRGVFVIEDISVSSPKFNLIRDANGAWHVGNLLKGLRSGKKKNGGSKQVSWLKFTTVRVDDGTINIYNALTEQKLSVNNLSATVDVVSKKVTIHPATLLLGESRYQVQGEITDFNTPRIVGKLFADALNIDEIIRLFTGLKTSAGKSGSPKSPNKPGFSAEVAIEADSLRFGKLRTGAVSTVWHTSDKKQEFSPFHLEAFGGELKGVFDFTIVEGSTSWHIDFTGKEMAIELVFDQFLEGTTKREAKGLLSAKGTLRGFASHKGYKMWRSLNGELTFEATEGAIKKSPLLNSIVLVMQLPVGILFAPEVSLVDQLQETAKKQGRNLLDTRVMFKKIDSTFYIADGVAHTENSHFAGKTVDLLFTGDIDLAEKQMDMKIKAATIGAVGLVLPKVPVVGKKLEKAREAALSLTFRARGPLGEPKLHLSPMGKLKPKGKK